MTPRTRFLVWLLSGIPLLASLLDWIQQRPRPEPARQPEALDDGRLEEEELRLRGLSVTEHTHRDTIEDVEIHGDGLVHAHVFGEDARHRHYLAELQSGIDPEDPGWVRYEEAWVRA